MDGNLPLALVSIQIALKQMVSMAAMSAVTENNLIWATGSIYYSWQGAYLCTYVEIERKCYATKRFLTFSNVIATFPSFVQLKKWQNPQHGERSG